MVHTIADFKMQEMLQATYMKEGTISAFVELHIEQGPLLEQHGTQLGIVTAIAAPAALRVTFKGGGGHAGALLMPDRSLYLLQPFCHVCIHFYAIVTYFTFTHLAQYLSRPTPKPNCRTAARRPSIYLPSFGYGQALEARRECLIGIKSKLSTLPSVPSTSAEDILCLFEPESSIMLRLKCDCTGMMQGLLQPR